MTVYVGNLRNPYTPLQQPGNSFDINRSTKILGDAVGSNYEAILRVAVLRPSLFNLDGRTLDVKNFPSVPLLKAIKSYQKL